MTHDTYDHHHHRSNGYFHPQRAARVGHSLDCNLAIYIVEVCYQIQGALEANSRSGLPYGSTPSPTLFVGYLSSLNILPIFGWVDPSSPLSIAQFRLESTLPCMNVAYFTCVVYEQFYGLIVCPQDLLYPLFHTREIAPRFIVPTLFSISLIQLANDSISVLPSPLFILVGWPAWCLWN